MQRVDIPDEHMADPAAYAWAEYGGPIAQAGFGYSFAVYKHSQLSLRESEAARIRTAQINGCQICKNWRGAVDTPELLAAAGQGDAGSVAENGEAPDEAFYEAVEDWRGSPLFSDRERVALELAERMAGEPQRLAADEDFWARAKTFYSDHEIVDLTLSIGSWMAMGRATHILGLDQSCPLPSRAREAA